MAKYDLNGNEKDFTEGDLTEQQKMLVKKAYLGLDGKSKTRDEIAKQLGLRKDRVQPFFKYLSKNNKYKELHKTNFGERVEAKKYNIKDISKDYEKGYTIQKLQKKYHISTEKMESIVSNLPDDIKEKHKLKILKKRTIKGNYDDFYGKIVKNRNSTIVCRLRLINNITIQKYPDERGSEKHSTNFLTFNIKSKGDLERLMDSIEKNYGNIEYENGVIMCKDYKTKTIIPLNVLIEKIR